MASPKYRLTKAGKIVCFILVLVLVLIIVGVCGYFAAKHYLLSDDRSSGYSQDDILKQHQENDSNEQSGQFDRQKGDPDNEPSGQKPSEQEPSEKPDILPVSPAPTGAAIHISVYFEPQSSELTSQTKKDLNQFIEDTTGTEGYRITLEANCATVLKDVIPESARIEHQELAEARGNAVARYLSENRMQVTEVINFGAENPENDNSTFLSRVKNRRVDIYFYK